MKNYKIPFSHWKKFYGDSPPNEKIVRNIKKDGDSYFLIPKAYRLYNQDGKFKGKYKKFDLLENKHGGEDIFILAPGPTLKNFKKEDFTEKTTIAINSAMFYIACDYWSIVEFRYASFLRTLMTKSKYESFFPLGSIALCTGRSAMMIRNVEKKRKLDFFKEVYISRWEEIGVIPFNIPAISIFNSLVNAWQMDAKRVFLIGVDLSKTDARPYVEGVPYSQRGAGNPFDDQIKGLRQFQLPDFEVINCSPLSKDLLPFPYVSYNEVKKILCA